MVTIILIVLFASLFGYFATQNTADITLHFYKYTTHPLPIYLIILISIGIGLVVTMIINFLRWFTTNMKLSKKERELKKTEGEVNELTKTVHKLELRNTKLEGELGKGNVDEDSI